MVAPQKKRKAPRIRVLLPPSRLEDRSHVYSNILHTLLLELPEYKPSYNFSRLFDENNWYASENAVIDPTNPHLKQNALKEFAKHIARLDPLQDVLTMSQFEAANYQPLPPLTRKRKVATSSDAPPP